MAERGNRDQLVISTKFTSNYKLGELGRSKTANFGGNHRRSIQLSVRDSLKKLQTEYLDIIYMHWWDYTAYCRGARATNLHFLVEQGKVLYLGASGPARLDRGHRQHVCSGPRQASLQCLPRSVERHGS